MQKFYRMIVHHPKTILLLFIVLMAISFICKPLVHVNYDMNDYLPAESASTVALNVMKEEFDNGIPNARVLLYNVSIPESLEYKAALRAVDGVTDVIWLDDATDITIPLHAVASDLVSTYYRDGNAIMTVTISADKRVSAVENIRAIISDENAMTGAAVSVATATTSTVREVRTIAVIAVLFTLFVLLLTTESWLEPLVVLGSIGVAIMINSGSNLIFGTISFVTNAAGNVLQLAVSLDYAVFLLHRFTECRQDIENPQEALIEALCKSTSSIFASGFTTVIGFLALCLMRFGIGPDLGLALAKGISISLITTFIFTPALIISTCRLIDKMRHRSFMPKFTGVAKLAYRLQLPMICLFLLLIAPSYLASINNQYYYGASNIFGAETKLGMDTAAIENIFGQQDTYVLLVPRGEFAKEKQLSAVLQDMPEITGMISYVDNAGAQIPVEYVDEPQRRLLLSDDYSRLVISVDTALEGAATFDLAERIRAQAQSFYPDTWYLAGEGISTYDLMKTITADMEKVNLVAIGAVFLTLLLSLKSISLPIILVLCIETAVWVNMALPYFSGSAVFYIAYLIISSVQLGATVDYAILYTERYKECRQAMNKHESLLQSVSAVSISILSSGSVMMVVGFLLGMISSHGILSQLGYFLGKGTLCSLTIVWFVLPAFLYILDKPISKTTRKANFVHAKGKPKGKITPALIPSVKK